MEGHDSPLYLTLEYGSFINLEELRIRKKKKKEKKESHLGKIKLADSSIFQ